MTRDVVLSPDEAAQLARLGEAMLSQGRVSDAVIALHDAASNLPNDALVHARYGVALAKANRTSDALRALQTAVALDARSIEAWCIIAELCIDALDFKQATAALKTCFSLDPSSQHPAGMRARALVKKAEKLAKQATTS